jgi:hypothetical protein
MPYPCREELCASLTTPQQQLSSCFLRVDRDSETLALAAGLVKGILDERCVLKPNQVYLRLRKKMGSLEETEFDICGEVITRKVFLVR